MDITQGDMVEPRLLRTTCMHSLTHTEHVLYILPYSPHTILWGRDTETGRGRPKNIMVGWMKNGRDSLLTHFCNDDEKEWFRTNALVQGRDRKIFRIQNQQLFALVSRFFNVRVRYVSDHPYVF